MPDMDWRHLRRAPWLDRRARFLAQTPPAGWHLDAGCSTCGTLRHFMELRPDLRYTAIDLEDFSACVPSGVAFHRLNLIADALPFADGQFDSISLMHVAEHLAQFGKAPAELARVLKPGGRLYVEAPGPRSLLLPSSTRDFPLNFYDDPSHVAPMSRGRIAHVFGINGLRVRSSGAARSWLLILALPWSILSLNRFYFLSGLIHLAGSYVYVEFLKTDVLSSAG
jgi:SAM-dependent methyltransferase